MRGPVRLGVAARHRRSKSTATSTSDPTRRPGRRHVGDPHRRRGPRPRRGPQLRTVRARRPGPRPPPTGDGRMNDRAPDRAPHRDDPRRRLPDPHRRAHRRAVRRMDRRSSTRAAWSKSRSRRARSPGSSTGPHGSRSTSTTTRNGGSAASSASPPTTTPDCAPSCRSVAVADGDQVLDGRRRRHARAASVGFGSVPSDQKWEGRTRRRITNAWLDHIALTPTPAYLGAEVLAVRHAPTVTPDVGDTEPRSDPCRTGRAGSTLAPDV